MGDKPIGGDSMELDRTNRQAPGDMGKIRHAYIIYIDRPESIKYADECAKSCEQHGMPYTLWRGVDMRETRGEDLEKETGFTWTSRSAEMGCTASHLKLWHVIAEQPHACCIFEHDAIIKHNFYNYEIPDNKLVMLGYRVLNAEDYQYPDGDVTFMDINKFEGTHGYAITPNMAKYMIERMRGFYTETFGGVNTTIDGILSIHDSFGIARCVMDPPPVICVVGQDRVSTIQGRPAQYNACMSPGFVKGLKVQPLRVTHS
jgi:Glycosyltransferase family 25 (LPS biosynthesis protein)